MPKNEKIEDKLINYICADHFLFYLSYPDFFAVKDMINLLRKKNEEILDDYNFLEYVESLGCFDFDTFNPHFDLREDELNLSLDYCLQQIYEDSKRDNQVIILKDVVNNSLTSKAISYLKEIVEQNYTRENKTIFFIVESKPVFFPKELESLITIIDIKPLEDEEIVQTIKDFFKKNDPTWKYIDSEEILNFAYLFKGLQKYQIEQILTIVYVENDYHLEKEHQVNILNEKKQLIRKSAILEVIDQPMNSGFANKVGGLEVLKQWISDKEIIYRDIHKAQKAGVAIPKGILIAGMPGCGKSLAAKCTASELKVPLVRLDVGSLLGQYIGESEGNMRRALSLAESFSPCVLWIDELEKAFAGINTGEKNEGSEVVKRIFGYFLTWMQEKNNAVFIVATANNISNLPAEFKRKGRFDEIFYVGLPNEMERIKIFEYKLKEKNRTEIIDLKELAKETDGYSGSDIEAIINTAIEKNYINEVKKEAGFASYTAFNTSFIVDIIHKTKSISKMLGDQIKQLEDTFEKDGLTNASEWR